MNSLKDQEDNEWGAVGLAVFMPTLHKSVKHQMGNAFVLLTILKMGGTEELGRREHEHWKAIMTDFQV